MYCLSKLMEFQKYHLREQSILNYIQLSKKTIDTIANLPMFFAAIVETLLVVTKPDSKNKNPAAIHITRNPQTKKEKVLKIYATSASTSALKLDL